MLQKNKHMHIKNWKIGLGIVAIFFLVLLTKTHGFTELLPINIAYATHNGPYDCSDHWGLGSVKCGIEVIKNLAVDFALSLIFTFAWLIVAALWFSAVVIPRIAFWLIYELVVGISSVFIMLSTKLIESAVYPGEPIAQALLYNPALLDAIRTALWIPVRDLVNAGFALLLVAGAIITIIKASKETIAQYGPKFMIGIILVNFSWFIPRVILDVANVTAVASFSFAQCTNNCFTIETVGLLPFSCIEGPLGPTTLRKCPTLLLAVDAVQVQAIANPARKAMSALLKPFQEILDLRVLPRAGNGWERLSKLLAIFNNTLLMTPEIPPNPGYPPDFIGIGNIIKCVWVTCEAPPDPIIGRINTPGPFLDAVASLFVQTALGTLRIIILVFLAAIFLVLYVFALLAMMAMVLLRIPIIWLTMGFMPVVALAFVLGKGGTFSGFLWGVWDKFIGAAFIPAAIGIPVAAGSAVLNVAVALNPGLPGSSVATGIVADIFGLDGIIQIMFIIIAIIVIWLGVFAAISSLNFAGAAQQAIGNSIKSIGQGTAKATAIGIASKAPILPLGKMDRALGYGIGGMTAGAGWLMQKLGTPKKGPSGPAGAAPKPESPLPTPKPTGPGGAKAAATGTGTTPPPGTGPKPGPGGKLKPPPDAGPMIIGPDGKRITSPPPVPKKALPPERRKELVGRTIDVDGTRARVDKVSDDGETVSLTGIKDGTKYEAPYEKLAGARVLKEKEEKETEKTGTPAAGTAATEPTGEAPSKTAGREIGEEVREGARKGVIEGMGGKAAEEKEAPPTGTEGKGASPATEGIGWRQKLGQKLQEQGGKVMQRGAVGHVAAQGKQWWNEAAQTKTGQNLGNIANKVRGGISSLFSGSALQKMLVGTAFKGPAAIDQALQDYSRVGGQQSLASLLGARLRPPSMGGEDGKKAASLLSKDSTGKGRKFMEAAHTLQSNPDDLNAKRKLLEVLDELRKQGIKIDSTNIPGAMRTILDETQKDTSNNLNPAAKSINIVALEQAMIQAEKRAAAAPPPPPPPPHPTPPPPAP